MTLNIFLLTRKTRWFTLRVHVMLAIAYSMLVIMQVCLQLLFAGGNLTASWETLIDPLHMTSQRR